MEKCFIAFSQLLISHQKLPKAIEPGVRSFYHPTSVLRRTPPSPLLSCDPWGVPPEANLLADRLAVVPLIRIQESLPTGKSNDDCIKHRSELTDVMSIGPGDDQRQRDAMGVHQDMTLASLFFPGLSGSDRPFPGQGAP